MDLWLLQHQAPNVPASSPTSLGTDRNVAGFRPGRRRAKPIPNPFVTQDRELQRRGQVPEPKPMDALVAALVPSHNPVIEGKNRWTQPELATDCNRGGR